LAKTEAKHAQPKHTEAQRSSFDAKMPWVPDPSWLWIARYSAKLSNQQGSCMHLTLEWGVPPEERRKIALGALADRGAARVFLEVLRCATPFTRRRAVANGAGIGVFSTYACALGGKIIPLEVELRRRYDIWPSYRPGCGRIPTVRHMIDWLGEAFSPAKFPWFKDEFIHPSEFKSVYKGETLTHLFGGLLDRRTVEPE
jgi:DNA-binding transcriptional LysR family regulator